MSALAKLFLKLNGPKGPIAGDSRIRGYMGHIEIDDWSWSLQREKPPSGGDKDLVTVPSAIAFSKLMDRASTPMLTAMKDGDDLTAIITLEETASSQFKLVLKLEEARLLDYGLEIKGDEKGGSAEESWTLDYRVITIERTVEGGGTSSYKFQRPGWASNDAPASGTAKVEVEIGRLVKDLSPDRLNEVWEKIKKDHEVALLNPKGKSKDKDEGKVT